MTLLGKMSETKEDVRLVIRQRNKLYEALAAICSKPDGWCCCATEEQIEAGHTGECRDAQDALALVDSN